MKFINLTQGKYAIVDDDDYERLSQYHWHAMISGKTWYAKINHGGELMHRMVISTPKGFDTDHLNGNGLDNRKVNLRKCTKAQNQRNVGLRKDNKSGYKGVFYHKENNRWCALIRAGGRQTYLGSFRTPELANEAYVKATKELHGEFASCFGVET